MSDKQDIERHEDERPVKEEQTEEPEAAVVEESKTEALEEPKDIEVKESQPVPALDEQKASEEDENPNDDDSDIVVTPKEKKLDDEVKEAKPEILDEAKTPARIQSAETESGATAAKKSPPTPVRNKNYVYNVKWIRFEKQEIPIVMQNENGPCPLLSICNVLLLRRELEISRKSETITGDEIINKIADTLFNNFLPKWRDRDQRRQDERLNLEKNIDDALEILQGLERGLDVNVRFNRADSFEFTKEMVVFDIFSINLYHGWVVDPQEVELNSVVGDLSYNQLVDKVITLKNNSSADSNESFLIDHFLECTASQLTYHGLAELHSLMKPNELGIFFRNNHFSTIHKSSNGRLFTLVTDAGFLNRQEVVWETLTNIEGDELFCDSKFAIYNEPRFSEDQAHAPANEAQNEDYLLALALQRDQNDEQLAQIMQEEEEQKARAASAQQTTDRSAGRRPTSQQEQQRPQSQKKDKKGDSVCQIS